LHTATSPSSSFIKHFLAPVIFSENSQFLSIALNLTLQNAEC
jgi:hypothetical protein